MIQIEHLTKRYGQFTAVDDITFTVQPGTVVGFLGPNGAGKSTALRMVTGLTPPTSGRATVLGHAYRDLPNPGRHVGVMLDASAQHPGRAGREVLTIAALHTGLDFPAPTGTPIAAAAGGVVLTAEFHPQYGQMIELDHGNQLVTRYAHASRMLVKPGDLVKRGQKIAEVGSTGRSTGPHLHFEVLVDGVHQNPARFLKLKEEPPINFAETRTPLQ